MKKKSSLTLDNEFILYCEINGIENIDKLAKETFNRGFSLLKYGETPTGNSTIKEKIVEVIKEVIIEKELPPEIKYVDREVIKEVPIQIKGDTQVIINNDEIERLTKKNSELEIELENIKISLEKFNKATYMKNSDLGSLYSE